MLTSNRLIFFDKLKVVLMVAVIAHHVGQAYGPTGGSTRKLFGWMYVERIA